LIDLYQQIVTQEGQFMRKCYNQRCACKCLTASPVGGCQVVVVIMTSRVKQTTVQ